MLASIQLIPAVLSMLVIGAHFLRYGNYIIIGVIIILILALFIKHPLSARVMQLALLLSTVEWLRTAYMLVSYRMDAGLSWTRLALILGAVALFSFGSIFVFKTKRLKERYGL